MGVRFEELRVWRDALQYHNTAYAIIDQMPPDERFNLGEQLRRAATSIALNIAEGSTSQSRKENRRFLGYAVRSVVECVACHRLIQRRGYGIDPQLMARAEAQITRLFRRLQAFRRALGESRSRTSRP